MNSGPSTLWARNIARTPAWPCSGDSRPISNTGHANLRAFTCRCFAHGTWSCFAKPRGEPKALPSWP
eukprot:11223884-Lingulodinium_polyedra.AAC.1